VEKPGGNRQLGRQRRRWEGYNKIDLGEIGWSGIDCIDLAQVRNQWRALVNAIMNIRFPQNVGKFLSIRATDGIPLEAWISVFILFVLPCVCSGLTTG
jgi:hypothetical protein